MEKTLMLGKTEDKRRKRGFCWCVDKYGQPLPGFDVKGKGDVQCYSMESK